MNKIKFDPGEEQKVISQVVSQTMALKRNKVYTYKCVCTQIHNLSSSLPFKKILPAL